MSDGIIILMFVFAAIAWLYTINKIIELGQRDTEARRLLALARGVGEYGLGKEWVRDYEVFMGLPKETT